MLIRHAEPRDVDAVAKLEALCFPPEEAASMGSIRERIAVFPESFWLAESEDGQVVSCVDGIRSNQHDLNDDMYTDVGLHEPDGAWLMLFGVLTHPDRQGQGLAGALLRQALGDMRAAGCAGVVLTCKEHLLAWYGSFGFVDEGLSTSEHGGVAWNQMRVTF